MKSLIITDMHSEDPLPFIEKMQEDGIERLVCLGDCDEPGIAKRILALDMEKRFVISNHDYSHSIGEIVVSCDLELTPTAYPMLWDMYPDVKKAILDNWTDTSALEIGSRVIDELNGRKIVYTHGSTRYDNPSKIMKDRLITGDMMENLISRRQTFQKMIDDDYWISFRGHDHLSTVWSIPKKGPVFGIKTEEKDKGIKLFYSRRYIITIGSFGSDFRSRKHEYAIFDDETRRLEFREFESRCF